MQKLLLSLITVLFLFTSCDMVSQGRKNDTNVFPDSGETTADDDAGVNDEDDILSDTSNDDADLQNDEVQTDDSLNDDWQNDEAQNDNSQTDDSQNDDSGSDSLVQDDDTEADVDISADDDNIISDADGNIPDDVVIPDDDQPDFTVTIGTYNLENFFDTECDSGTDESGNCYDMELLSISDYSSKLASVENSIRSIGSDIQIIVEIEDDTAGNDLLNALSDIYDEVYIAVKYDGNQNVGVLTKGHITNVVNHGTETDFAREFAEIHINLDGHEIIVFPAHFKSKSNDDPDRRLREATKAAEIINNVADTYPDALIVLGGDLNDEPGSDPLNALDSADLLRTESDITPQNEQCTHNYGGCNKLDHLYLSINGAGEYVAGSAQVIKDGGCGYGDYCLGSSDHAALKADFKMDTAVIPDPETSTIYDIKQSIVPESTTVIVKGVVTAVSGNSFFIQTLPSEYDSVLQEKYSALFVYISSLITPAFSIPAEGDIVKVSGTTAVYYDEIQLGSVTAVEVTGTSDLPDPLSILPSAVRDVQYEGVLVNVGTVTVSSIGSYGDFTVTDGLVVDDDMYSISPSVGASYSLKGVMKYAFSEYRLLPRYASDVQEM